MLRSTSTMGRVCPRSCRPVNEGREDSSDLRWNPTDYVRRTFAVGSVLALQSQRMSTNADERTRTSTRFPGHGPEPCASTNSATSAWGERTYRTTAAFTAAGAGLHSAAFASLERP